MKLFDFAAQEVKEVELKKCNIVYTTFAFEKETLNNYNAFLDVLTVYIQNMIDRNKVVENTFYDIQLLGDFDSSEIESFIYSFSMLFTKIMCGKSKRYEEDRLACDNSRLNLTYGMMMKMINYKTRINCFGFCIHYKDMDIELVGG